MSNLSLSYKGIRRARISSLTSAKFVAALFEGATKKELQEVSGLSSVVTARYLYALRKEGVCYIEGWETDALGRYTVASHRLGTRKDTPKPQVSSRSTRYRQGAARRALEAGRAGLTAQLAP